METSQGCSSKLFDPISQSFLCMAHPLYWVASFLKAMNFLHPIPNPPQHSAQYVACGGQ